MRPIDRPTRQDLLEPCVPSSGDPYRRHHPRAPAHPLRRTARTQMLARADELGCWCMGLLDATRGYAAYTTLCRREDPHGGGASGDIAPDRPGLPSRRR